MLKIFPIQDKARQKDLAAQCHVPYLANDLAYEATVDDIAVGICQFALKEDGGVIDTLAPVADCPRDNEALFIMCRAAMNFIDLHKVHLARFTGDVSLPTEELIHAIGFRRGADGAWTMDLTGFFSSPCQHHTDD